MTGDVPYRSQYFEDGRTLTAAISTIDIALYDLVGKALGAPVYQLLGGKQRDRVPCFVTTSVPMGPELVDRVQDLVGRGWESILIGLGMPKRPVRSKMSVRAPARPPLTPKHLHAA